MTTTSAALTCLAAALLVVDSRTGTGRLRAMAGPATNLPAPAVIRPTWIAVGAVALGAVAWAAGAGFGGVLLGVVAGLTGGVAVRHAAARAAGDDDGAALAGAWELLAVCLQVGLPVAAAVSAAAERLAGNSGRQLRRVAGLLELGADPPAAWHDAQALPALAAFARAAGRAAGTGAALAQVARAESTRIRADLVDTAEARAQRAAVHITGPLGLCFLPAFLVLGIAPVVIGLTGHALAQW
ncbi:MAG: type II secretion system F family protein [Pseudonocardia sp.]